MPKLSKISEDEIEKMKAKRIGPSEREKTRQQYVDYLKNFGPGDWVSVELEDGEKRQTVKNRLKAAAKELGYHLNFLRSRGALRFEIQKAK